MKRIFANESPKEILNYAIYVIALIVGLTVKAKHFQSSNTSFDNKIEKTRTEIVTKHQDVSP